MYTVLITCMEADFRIIAHLCVHTRTQRLTGKPAGLQIRVRTITASNSPLTCKYDQVSLIKYNVIHHSFSSYSSSQVSLYGPPLNQLCQDDLPRTSNTPLYQSQVPFSGFLLLNHARTTYTSTIKCRVSYLDSTISPPKDLRCPQRDHSTQLSFLGRLQR